MNFRSVSLTVPLILAAGIFTRNVANAASCEGLKSLSLENTTITLAERALSGAASERPGGRLRTQGNRRRNPVRRHGAMTTLLPTT